MSQGRPTTLLPGTTIGLIGGGQLGRMTAMAARGLGYRVHTLDASAEAPARGVSDHFVEAPFDDADAARAFAADVDVITCDREDIPVATLNAAGQHAPVYPGPHVLQTVQDRGVQKNWLAQHGFPVGPYRGVQDLAGLEAALAELGPGARIKRTRGGFDGRAQWVANGTPASELWQQAGEAPVVVEKGLDLAMELSVMVARSPSAELAVFPVSHNFHVKSALHTNVIPAALPEPLLARARSMASDIAVALDVVGLVAVEMFVTGDGDLLVNELAPRPHNTFHASEWACHTSQFEQLVRAICGVPLGSTAVRQATAVGNLFGDLWLAGHESRLLSVLENPSAQLRLYDKAPRPRRKLGHVAFIAETPAAALHGVRALLTELEAESQTGEAPEAEPTTQADNPAALP